MPLLCLSQYGENTGADTGSFSAGPGNLMGVNGLGDIGIRMAQLVCSGYGINAAGNQNGCYRVTESVGMDMGQIICLTEFANFSALT